MARVEKGIAAYLDREMMPKVDADGLQGFGVGIVTTLLIKRVGNVIDSYKDNKIAQALGVFDKNGNVDVDVLREVLKDNISDNGRKMTFPIVGSFTFYRNDVDMLYSCIMEAGDY
jgi:Ca2+-binding EF-hand superfamily protein